MVPEMVPEIKCHPNSIILTTTMKKIYIVCVCFS